MMEGLVRSMWKEALGVELPNPFPVMTYAEAMARLRLRQARPARVARADRAHRPREDSRVQGVPQSAAELPNGRVAALRVPGRRCAVAQGDRRLRAVRRDLRRQGPRVDQGQRRRQAQRGRAAVADRQVPARSGAARDPRAHRRADRRRDLLRRRQGEGRQRRARRAARQARPRARIREQRVEAAVGRRLPDVRVRRGQEDVGGAPSPVHRAQGRARGPLRDRSGATRSPRPTTS